MRVGEYLRGTKEELENVRWPSRRQAALFTAIVIVFSLTVASLLGFFDAVFSFLIRFFL